MTSSANPKSKPCVSPYCECTPGQCSHPGYYDARHETHRWPKHLQPANQVDDINVVDIPKPKQPAPRWPFPIYPNPKDRPDGKQPKFNPNNHDDAPL